ncbi:tRNA pseudouridine(13) synthase TruD [Pasteurellaceae bacterium HPA106]|uniref:tRNA pseudouridine(13) synthase TruD n=1 Tax=Spirabiliibacterium pneumoniae TaxID=221400 RepID=UPI001AACFEE9|nr:tRNA pseudouridine(13) synthase TruD [Spirabiliibacterium pneumoniae]MBE2897147.1 tRNA pseudouridine(13) synthase TruD [Spirabiliibacterium pneumoniae]
MTLAYLYGQPHHTARLKVEPNDFCVQEILGYDMAGEGEFVALYVRKTHCNTLFVGERLAKFAGVGQRDWSYAGLKDRHGVTEQWFCLHLPGKPTPDFSTFTLDGVEILQVTRHNRKIRIGSLQGNHFDILLRDVSESPALHDRLEKIQKCGFPNYFTEQRFGRDGNNLTQAQRWAAGEITVRDRNKRSFYLSAARSALFNQVVSARIAQGVAREVLVGDVVQLCGSHSWFIAREQELAQVQQRLASGDVQLTAPMFGEQGALSEQAAQAFELSVLNEQTALCDLLKQARVKSDRRALCVLPENLTYAFEPEGLRLRFTLGSGSYATALVRELVNLEDEGM